MVLVSSPADYGVERVDVESFHDAFEQFFRHVVVVYHSDGFTAFPAFHAFCHLLHHSTAEVVVHFHFCVFCKLKRVSFVSAVVASHENHWQTESYHIVEKHDVFLVVALRQSDKSSHLLVGHGYEGVVGLWLFLPFDPFHLFHGEEDAVVHCCPYLFHLRQPYGIGRAVEFVEIESAYELLLFVVELVFMHQFYALSFQFASYVVDSLLKLFVVAGVEMVYVLYGAFRPFAVVFYVFVLRLCNAVERCHSYAEKLVEIV